MRTGCEIHFAAAVINVAEHLGVLRGSVGFEVGAFPPE